VGIAGRPSRAIVGVFRVFLIRQSRPEDVATLHKLARMVYFINLPPDERIIGGKIEHSIRCFRKIATGAAPAPEPPKRRRGAGGGFAHTEQDSDLFMFTIEEPETGAVIGTSQVRARQGGPGDPNWAFRISEKTYHSKSLGFGTTHTVGQLYGDESGPSEVGGLILQPSHRGHRLRPGRLLAFIRFHFMALHRATFADRILAEMMAPVTSDGDNVFWDHFGRKFIPVKYAEADRFCQHNRGFIAELLPKEEIFITLFPLEVQNMVGVVSKETIPARRMLENLGFRYRNFIDPFDGGPHLDAVTADVPLIRDTRRTELGRASTPERCTTPGIVSALDSDGRFRATETMVEAGDAGPVRLPPEAMALLEADAGAQVGFTPLTRWADPAPVPAKAAKPKRRVKA